MSRAPDKARWALKLAALLLPLALLLSLDLGLRGLGWIPPDDPLLFDARSFERSFFPFIEGPGGTLHIRPDWINDGESLYTEERGESGHYFLYPGFRPSQLTREKPPGHLRIFVLGGSTTFGLYVGQDEAFPSLLRTRLQLVATAEQREVQVEVINLGCPGWATTRVLNLMRSLLDLDPDLIVIYSGHNEMLRGEAGDVTGLDFGSALRARMLSLSILYRWVNHALTTPLQPEARTAMEEEEAARKAGQILTYDPLHAPADEKHKLSAQGYREMAARRYRHNLRDIVATGRAASLPVLLVLPTSNLFFPPSLSGHRANFDQHAELRKLLRQAREAREQERFADALEALETASRLSPEHAMTHYRMGTLLALSNRRSEALAQLRLSRDWDIRIHRMTTPLEEVFEEVVQAESASWIDPRPHFEAELSREFAGAHFIDTLHPTPFGHQLLAEELTPVAAALLGLQEPPR